MPKDATVAELFGLAIDAEKAAEELYRGLEGKFAHHREVADFWRECALEEAEHARQLERLRDTLSPEELSAPADPAMLKDARKILQFSVENTLKGIENLDDAYRLVNEMENAETNAIFLFLITSLSLARKAQAFLRSQLKHHVARITDEFPAQFGDAASRRAIRALSKSEV